ncbi:MAG TPA: rhodanese-like domain-containing protein [Pyrinomonadaceae bacterium]|nr:rhodanese-like domain-containing protein [Pyrinomonadaceae bacterium]
MHLKVFYFATILAAAMLVACNAVDMPVASTPPKPTSSADLQAANPDGARRITIEEFEALMKEGKAFVVDVRNQAAYDLGHIPGARLIPAGDILNHLDELPRDKTIVTYCS